MGIAAKSGRVGMDTSRACRDRAGRARSASRGGFTLVELLVVIGIIAVLISILLPTLGAARRQADTVKCASALREIGNGLMMYVNEYRGYTIPARLLSAGTDGGSHSAYNLDGVLRGASSSATDSAGNVTASTTSAYWTDFLTKYVARGKKTGTNSSTAQQAADAQNSVLWGCPTFQRYISTALGGFNRVQTGYGINYVPTYSPTNPSAGTGFPAGTFDSGGVAGKNTIVGSTNNWTSITHGTWFKHSVYSQPSERAFLADAQFWLLEANPAPSSGVIPPQKTSNNSATYSSGVSGQTLFDFYRHGKTPRVEVPGTTGYYSATGGKVLYNVLYADGHVGGETSRETAYRSVRRRFPG